MEQSQNGPEMEQSTETQQPAPAEPKTYGGEDHDLREAAADLQKAREDGALGGDTERKPPEPDEPPPRQFDVDMSDGPNVYDATDRLSDARALQDEELAQYEREMAEQRARLNEVMGEEPGQEARADDAAESAPDVEEPAAPAPQQAPPAGVPSWEPDLTDPTIAAAAQEHERLANERRMLGFNFARTFPDINSHDDLAAVARVDPQRAATAQAWDEAARELEGRMANISREARGHQFSKWAEKEDQKFSESFKEDFDTQEKKGAANKYTLKFLNDLGFTNEQIREGWEDATRLSLRSAPVQKVIWMAAKYQQTQDGLARSRQEAADARRRNVPKVQRPGVALTPAERKAAAYSATSDQLRDKMKSSSGVEQMQTAVKLLQHQRRGSR